MTAEAIVKRRRVAAPRLTDVDALVIRVEESVDGGLLRQPDEKKLPADPLLGKHGWNAGLGGQR